MTPEERLAELGIQLPPPFAPPANFVPAVQSGRLVFLSGHGPTGPGGALLIRGRLGDDLALEQGYEAARLTALALLGSLKGTIGELDRVSRIVKLLGLVRCTPDFGQQPAVIDGASDLLVELFGERGRHARSAIGMQDLPFGMPVEIEMVVEVQG
ncbi:RidA family protein [Tepidiforma sp.]|uniref:RidA family protein n=1 Tax=Tepidiforma sp. TaxID=2682230 RepID=UPI002ADD5E80|nr:RidA family protein [Tepidiforma sp.]